MQHNQWIQVWFYIAWSILFLKAVYDNMTWYGKNKLKSFTKNKK